MSEWRWRRRFEAGALDADVGSHAQRLQALLAGIKNTTAVHIKDLSLGKHAATPGTALGVDGAVRASALCVAAAVRRAMRAAPSSHRAAASLLCAPCWPASATDAPTRAATCCLLCADAACVAMPLPEDFRL